MSTTGTYGFSPMIAGIVDEAFERAGVDPAAITSRHITSARRSLQYIYTEWSTQRIGIHQWCIDEQTQPLVVNDDTFNLPTGSIDILSAVLRLQNIDTEMYALSREDWLLIPNKENTGRPDRYFVDRQRDLPVVHLWPVCDQTYSMVYWRLRHLQLVGGAQNTADVPERFQDALAGALAFRLATKFNVDRVPMLKRLYEQAYDEAAEDDGERAPLVMTYSSGR